MSCLLCMVLATWVPPVAAQTADAPLPQNLPVPDQSDTGGANSPSGSEAPTPAVPTDPLASKQAMIRDRFERFRDRVYRMQERLVEAEPDNARRLASVLQREGEFGLSDRLQEIIQLLEAAQLDSAEQAQVQWAEDVGGLLDILLERDAENAERKEELDRLEAYQQAVKRLLEAQRALRSNAGRSAAQQQMAQQLDQAIQRIDELRQRQEGLRGESERHSREQQAPREGLSQTQDLLGHETIQLLQDLKRLSQLVPDPASDSPATEWARKQAGESSADLDAASGSMADAAESLRQSDPAAAAQEQSEAEQDLLKARERLERAKKGLEAELKGLSRQAEEQRGLSQETGRVAENLRNREAPDAAPQKKPAGSRGSQDGSKGSKGGKEGSQGQQGSQGGKQGQQAGKQGQQGGQQGKQGQQGGQQGQQGGQQGQQGGQKGQQDQSGGEQPPPESPENQEGSVPGEQGLENAQEEMDRAADALEKWKPDDATQHQDKAIAELEQARQELEEILNQMRQEDRAETLRDLEARFRDMLVRQRRINDGTLVLDRQGRVRVGRAERLQAGKLSTDQRKLGDDAAACVHILDEEGTSIVFPRIIEQVSEDMVHVADRLAQVQTGLLTQTIQAEIQETLEQLVESIQKMQQQNEQGSSAGGQQQDKPLLPVSGELKLLRASQVRVNSRTKALQDLQADVGEQDSTLNRALKDTAVRQEECATIARDLRDRQ